MKKLELEYYPIGTKVYQTDIDGSISTYYIGWVNIITNIKDTGEVQVDVKYTIKNSYGQTKTEIRPDDIGNRYFLDPKELLNNLIKYL